MSYNILGVNISHNGSICVLSDGKIDFFIEEERISRKKYDNLPLVTIQTDMLLCDVEGIFRGFMNLYQIVNLLWMSLY